MKSPNQPSNGTTRMFYPNDTAKPGEYDALRLSEREYLLIMQEPEPHSTNAPTGVAQNDETI